MDIGCGDGFFSIRFWNKGKPRAIVGVDASLAAIEVAKGNKKEMPIEFVVGDVHRLPWPDNTFDLALIQSILHHDDNPVDIIREAFRLAPEILIREPNGNNIGLKVIEKLSPYHRQHQEKSYTSLRLKRWIRQQKGEVLYQKFSGFVLMFCPDWLAKLMKSLEPATERIPLLNALCSAEVILVARRSISNQGFMK